MSAIAWRAYGNARVRARKSRLLPPASLLALAVADRPDVAIDGWRDLGSDGDATALVSLVYARLIGDYLAAIRAYPAAEPIFRALARLHELENVKLAWRAVMYSTDAARWHSLWRSLGPLETVSRSTCTDLASIQQGAAALAGTPFKDIAAVVARVHQDDLAAAEVAFDRWGSNGLATAANALRPSERGAGDLVRRVVCERDVAVIERAVGPLGLPASAAMRMTTMLARALGPAGRRRFVEWAGQIGAPLALPRWLAAARPVVRTFAELGRAIRAARRSVCHRVFLGNPFSLAPPIALVLLREDEARALIAIAELRARRASIAETARVLELDG